MIDRDAAALWQLLDEISLGVSRIAPDGRFLEVNRSLCRLLGYDRDELLLRRYEDITHPQDVGRDRELFARLLAGEIGICSSEERYIDKADRTVQVRVTSSLVRSPDLHQLCIVEDLRPIHDAEVHRREGEARLHSILETVPDAMIVISDRGIVETFSASAERLFGYAAEEVIGRNVSMLMPSPYHEQHDGYLARYHATGERRIIGTRRVVTGRREDGSIFPMEISVGEATAEGRQIFTGFVRDLTERHEADRRFDRIQRELMHVARLSEMGQMGSSLAHELNQPLTAIANYLRAAKRLLGLRGADAVERVGDAVEKAAAQAERAGQIIRRLRSFIEKRETDRRKESLNEVVEEASALGLVGAKTGGVFVRMEMATSRPFAVIDKIQIQQVVVNLVRNAVEAMATAEEKVLTVRTAQDGDVVQVEVRDTGPGLTAEQSTQLFKPFFTTKEKGMGIGLSISRQIVEAHGGSMGFERAAGGGASFFFSLPLSPAAAPDEPGPGRD
jgi:two-component system sensor kinase FixL